ncbi:MAG: 5-formyltetrahydrofolate cyclo-ligase [Alphaproteobacteria bacterium]|nr:5-formyltetrahydrofolate cyclo-ligase [Alphaproteobacteria bacterium]
MLSKPQLRSDMQTKRASLGAVQIAQTSQAIARHFADHPILAFAPSCAGYIAMRGEVDVMPILAFMQNLARETALPRITLKDAPLTFHQWRAGEALETHTLGMKEPLASAPIAIPNIILVPLLAFDAAGYRLGYGGGYYDRTMQTLRAEAKAPLFIGVAYSWQEVKALPAEPHDAKLDGILTELGVSLFP